MAKKSKSKELVKAGEAPVGDVAAGGEESKRKAKGPRTGPGLLDKLTMWVLVAFCVSEFVAHL